MGFRLTSVLFLSLLCAFCAADRVLAQEGDNIASIGSPTGGPYLARPFNLSQGRLRIDLAPPDYGYMDHGDLNNGRGLRVLVPEHGDAFVGLGVGAGYGVNDNVEAGGLIFPFVIAPDFDFGDMELYCRYAFVQSRTRLGVQTVIRIPTASDFALSVGFPAQFLLGDSTRIDTGAELELIFEDDARVNLDIPLAVNVDIGGSAFLGARTGLYVYDLDELAINLGVQGGGSVDPMVDLTASLNFPRFLWTGPGDAFNVDIVEIVAGATIFLDVQ